MPAGLTRRPQKSELIRSLSCKSGPDSSSTTVLPALASTEAYKVPEAPAPTMTTSIFSLAVFSFAMSPPLRRRDVGHVGNAERGIAFHRAVDDIDGITAQYEVDEGTGGTLPAVDLILAHQIDQGGSFIVFELGKAAVTVMRLACLIYGAERGAIEISIRRPHVENARFEQGLAGRDRKLLIDKVGDAGLFRAGHQRFAHSLQCF